MIEIEALIAEANRRTMETGIPHGAVGVRISVLGDVGWYWTVVQSHYISIVRSWRDDQVRWLR